MSTSETSKYRYLTEQYCGGCGVDIGSGGDPVVPWAISIDLPQPYGVPMGDAPIHLRTLSVDLHWFGNRKLDFIYSSHLIEDFDPYGQIRLLREWDRVLKSGGHMIILAPERGRWKAALAAGQPPNDAHKHELAIGELTTMCQCLFEGGYEVLYDDCPDPNDYGIVFVARKR